MLYGKKQQLAAAVPIVASATDMASTILHTSLYLLNLKEGISNNARGRSVWITLSMPKRLYMKIIADQVFRYFVTTCIIIIIIIIIIKYEHVVKWRMQNNHFDYKSTDERLNI